MRVLSISAIFLFLKSLTEEPPNFKTLLFNFSPPIIRGDIHSIKEQVRNAELVLHLCTSDALHYLIIMTNL